MRATTPKDLRELMIVRCKDCKHKPERGENKWANVYGPKVPSSDYAQHMMVEDEMCPFLCDDPFYSEIPPDDFFCAYGEAKDDKL